MSVLGISQLGELKDIRYGAFQALRGDAIRGHNNAADFFYDFWTSLEHPTRADINPTKLKPFLDHIVLMDVIDSGSSFSLVTRLIGTYVAGYYGEIAGQDIREMGNRNAAERIYTVSQMVIDEKQPILTLTPGFDSDRKFLEAIALYMPLFEKGGNRVEKFMVSVDIVPVVKS